jgi:hypothetical protein
MGKNVFYTCRVLKLIYAVGRIGPRVEFKVWQENAELMHKILHLYYVIFIVLTTMQPRQGLFAHCDVSK